MQDKDFARQAHHHVHIVLDQDDDHVRPREGPQTIGERPRLLEVQACCGFVQEENAGAERDRASDLEQLAMAVGEILSPRACEPFEAEPGKHSQGCLIASGRDPAGCGRPEDLQWNVSEPGGEVADLNVLDRGHALKQPQILKRPSHADARESVRRQVGYVLPIQGDLARRHWIGAARHVDGGRLSGPVRPDHGRDDAGTKGEVQACNGRHRAEVFRNILEEEHQRQPIRPSSQGSPALCGRSPPGLRTTMHTRNSPNRSIR